MAASTTSGGGAPSYGCLGSPVSDGYSADGAYYLGESLGALRAGDLPIKEAAPRETVLPDGFNGAVLDQAVDAARAVVPDLHITLLEMPFHKGAGITIFGYFDGLIDLDHGNRVIVDPVTFEVLGQFSPENFPTLIWMSQINNSLHIGLWGGFFSRVLWATFGLFATFLCLSGAMIYASRVANGPDGANRTAAGRIWQGMSPLKWGLVFFVIAIIALSIRRFAF